MELADAGGGDQSHRRVGKTELRRRIDEAMSKLTEAPCGAGHARI